MTIQKPDFNQIFASQAPDVDKPPVFNNYNGGWGDESRPNNGKPTIKGFNYIQQLNDNKFLWMAQNGAFPYDPNTEYNVGVVTLKDGRFKQWNGTDWINFSQDDSALKSANNLSDLPNKETSRTNLGVYSKSETDAKLAPTPNASETVAGKAKIATTAIAQEGVNDTDIMTPAKVRLVSFGRGQTRKSVTIVSGVEYTNTTSKPIVVGVVFRYTGANTSQYLKASLVINSIAIEVVVANYAPTPHNPTIAQVILPNEKYIFRAELYSTIQSAWEVS